MSTVFKLRDLETGAPYLLLPGTLEVGRSEEADIQLSDDSVSRCHARIHNLDSGVYLEDLGSSNGTFVDGKRVENTVHLGLGSEIYFGYMQFRLDPEVGEANSREELVPPPPVNVESFHHKTNKIPPADPKNFQPPVKPRIETTESGHLVTVHSAAFPGGAMFPKKAKTTTTPIPQPPPPVPKAGRTPQMPLFADTSSPSASLSHAQMGLLFVGGIVFGLLLGVVLTYVLFVNR